LAEDTSGDAIHTVSGALLRKAQADRRSWALDLEEGLALAREGGPGSLEVLDV